MSSLSTKSAKTIWMLLGYHKIHLAASLPRGWAVSITADTTDEEIAANATRRFVQKATEYRDALVAIREFEECA